jgi:hypothetical protein
VNFFQIMEEGEKTEINGQDEHRHQAKPESTSSDSNLSNVVVGQMPSGVTDFACAGIQRRPRQTDQKFMTPQEVGLILRQLGDNLEKIASEQEANRTEKGG